MRGYQMLHRRLGVKATLLFRLLQGGARRKNWAAWVRQEVEYDQELADRFARTLLADGPFLQRLTEVCDRFAGVRRVPPELNRDRIELTGELRRRLADACVDALEPEL
jgi:hypothetical protein